MKYSGHGRRVALAALSLSVLALSCASVDLRKDILHSPRLTTADGDPICAFDRAKLIVTATNSGGKLCATLPEAFPSKPLRLPPEAFRISSSSGAVVSNSVFILDKSTFRYILVGSAGFSVQCVPQPGLSFEQDLPFNLVCSRFLDYGGLRGRDGIMGYDDGRNGTEGGRGTNIDVYLARLAMNGADYMFLKVECPGTNARSAYYLFPDGTTNIVISVRGGDGGNGGNGRDGKDGTSSSVNGKRGGNGGNAGRGGRSGRIRFFYSAPSSGWLKNFIFYTNAGACGFPGYAGQGGLGYRSSSSKIANGRTGANGYHGRPCSEQTPDGPAPFFMQYDPASALTDEIAASLQLK